MKQSQNQNNKRGRGRGRRQPQNQNSRNQESNGPDVKIRGNTSHIADKYLTLARDALSSGDRVAAENYFQHAEHYLRIIAAAKENQKSSENSDAQASGGDDQSSDKGRGKKKPRHKRNGKDPVAKEAASDDTPVAETNAGVEGEGSDQSADIAESQEPESQVAETQVAEKSSEEVSAETGATDAVA